MLAELLVLECHPKDGICFIIFMLRRAQGVGLRGPRQRDSSLWNPINAPHLTESAFAAGSAPLVLLAPYPPAPPHGSVGQAKLDLRRQAQLKVRSTVELGSGDI